MKNLIFIITLFSVINCGKGESQEEGKIEENSLPEVYNKVYGASSIALQGDLSLIHI